MRVLYVLTITLLLWVIFPAVQAAEPGAQCDHKVFTETGCAPDLVPIKRIPGPPGPQGEQGPPGGDADATQQIRNLDRLMSTYIAATTALDIQIPSAPGKSRMSLGVGSANGFQAVGVGYSYAFRQGNSQLEKPVVSVGLAQSHGQVVAKGTFSWEF